MADQIDSQAQAADVTSPNTAVENQTASTPVSTATESDVNTQPNPTAPAELDVEGMDAAAYAKAAEDFRNGKIPAEAQAPTEPAEEATPEPSPTEEKPKVDEKPTDDDDGPGSKRIRLTDLDDRQIQAVKLVRDLKKNGQTITLAEAEKRVNALYGDEGTPTQETADAGPSAPADIETRITELRAEYKKAAADVDTMKMAEIQEQIETARDQLATAKDVARTTQETERAALETVKTELRTKYPDFAKKDSALSLKWAEIHARLSDENHPILDRSAEATRYITFLAAEELGIAPVGKSAPAPAKASPSIPPTTVQKVPPVQPGSGALRTTAPADANGQIEKRIASVTTLEEYEKLKQELSPAA